jgi:hypothetical protein
MSVRVKTVEIVADLLASFAKATVTDAMNPNIRLFPADGVLKEALFAHPRNLGEPARIVFTQKLPKTALAKQGKAPEIQTRTCSYVSRRRVSGSRCSLSGSFAVRLP